MGCEAARIRGGGRNLTARLRLGSLGFPAIWCVWVADTAGRSSSRPVAEPWLSLEAEAAARVDGVCPHVRRLHRIFAGWRGDSVAGAITLLVAE